MPGNSIAQTKWSVSSRYAIATETFMINRGFTGHEHYNEFNLIDMNGRVYDPLAGRFLSPDPIIQSPDFTQSYNSYSYCFNNPLIYTDPSGYSKSGPGGDDDGCNTNSRNWNWWNSVCSWFMNLGNGNSSKGNYSNIEYQIWHLELVAMWAGLGFNCGTSGSNGSTIGGAGGSNLQDGYSPILYTNQTEGFNNLINGCFVGNNPKNNWRFEQLALITNKGIVVLPGSGIGWSNTSRDCSPSLYAGIDAGIIKGKTIIVNGNTLNIIGTIHTQPSCDQLVAIKKIEKQFCDEITHGPSWNDGDALSRYGSYFVYDFETPNQFWQGRKLPGVRQYGVRTLPFKINFMDYLYW